MPQSAGHIRYMFVAFTLRAKWATMLAPQQTMMRASANLRCEGAAASLQALIFLDFEHPTWKAEFSKSPIISTYFFARFLKPTPQQRPNPYIYQRTREQRRTLWEQRHSHTLPRSLKNIRNTQKQIDFCDSFVYRGLRDREVSLSSIQLEWHIPHPSSYRRIVRHRL